MFFDIGWSEIMLIGGVALVVIGPKDLPKAMRSAGYWVRKARSLSREFQGSVEQMMRESELGDLQQQLREAASLDLNAEFHKTIDPDGSLARSLEAPKLPDFSLKPAASQPAEALAAAAAATAPALPVPEPPPVRGFD